MTAVPDPPVAPGAIGVAIESNHIFQYLAAVTRWRDDLRDTLDELDRRAQIAQSAAAFTGDVTLAMAMWQSVANRIDEITTTWDSGRVLRPEREVISQLIWGRLDGRSGAGLSVSFTDACTLVTALARQLQSRLDADALAGSSVSARIGPVREQLARCRAQVGAAGTDSTKVDQLSEQLEDLVDRLMRGERVESEFATLEQHAQRLERDLIVAASTIQDIERDVATAAARMRELEALEQQVRDTAERCRDKIAHPPKLAVPDVSALGPAPTNTSGDRTAHRAALNAYLARLALVDAALDMALDAYEAPLEERDNLRGMLDGYRAMAGARGHSEHPQLAETYARAHDVLWSAPCDLAVARELVASYQQLARNGAKEAPR